MNRREFIKTGIAAGAAMALPYQDLFAQGAPLVQKKIPSSGELIPIIGLGTARRYEEVKTDAEKVPLRETIAKFKELGLKSHRFFFVLRYRGSGGRRACRRSQDSRFVVPGD